MRSIAPPALLASLLIAICITLAAVAASLALVRPGHAEFGADMASRLYAYYSASGHLAALAPLAPEIIEAAGEDEGELADDRAEAPAVEIVPVLYIEPPAGDGAGRHVVRLRHDSLPFPHRGVLAGIARPLWRHAVTRPLRRTSV
jgi:hypothetical protein